MALRATLEKAAAIRARLPGVTIALCLAMIVLCGVLHQETALRPTGVSLRGTTGALAPVTFPYTGMAQGLLEFDFTVHRGPLAETSVVVVPDDHFVSLSVGGVDVPLTGIPKEALDDYGKGFRLPLLRYLAPGDNKVVAKVLNRGGAGGLDVHADPHGWQSVAELVGATLALLVLVARTMRAFGVAWSMVGVWVVSLAVRISYLAVTPFLVRNHDVDGHIPYVEYILRRHALPGASEGPLFYHPPLYYLLAAVQWDVLERAGAYRYTILRSLQVQSLVYELGFVVFSIATAKLWLDRLPADAFGRRLASRPGLTALLAALLLLWPSTVIHSVRIGNDDLSYLVFGAAFYFASRWWIRARDRDLYVAALFGALGMVTKTSALLVFALLGVLFIVRLVFLDRERKVTAYLKRAWPVVLLFVGSTALALGSAIAETLAGRRPNLLVANVGILADTLNVGNRAENYLWFDVKTFVVQAFTSPADDAKGRQFFWNYAMKTSLFGEFSFDHPWLWNIAVVVSVLLLLLLAYVLAGLLLASTREWVDELPLIAATALLFAGLAMLRISVPKACSNDFRYILPVVLPLAYGFIKSLTVLRRRGQRRLAGTACAVGWAFVVASAAFFVVLAATDY